MKAQKGGKPYEERQKALKQPINLHFIYISNTNGEKHQLFAVCVFHKCSVKLSIRRRILIYGKNPRRLYELLIYVVCADWKHNAISAHAACACFLHAPTVYEVTTRRLRPMSAYTDSVRGTTRRLCPMSAHVAYGIMPRFVLQRCGFFYFVCFARNGRTKFARYSEKNFNFIGKTQKKR